MKVVKTYGGAYGNKPGLIKEQLRKDGVNDSELEHSNYPFIRGFHMVDMGHNSRFFNLFFCFLVFFR